MHGGFTVELRKFVVPEFVFGNGAPYLTRRYARNLGGRKILVVTDPGIVAAGLTGAVLGSLEEEGLPYAVYSGVTPNPNDTEVASGVEVYREEECNMLVAVGGGSPTDCAKGIGIVISNGGDILDYEGVDKIVLPCPPLICVPTTGSGADISQFAIITDEKKQKKIAIVSKALVPEVSLIDPGSTATIPPAHMAAIDFDTLVHSIEAYVSNASSPITDLLALDAVRLASDSILPALQNPREPEPQFRMALAALEGAMAFSNASLGIVHAMAHALGGYLNSMHGEMTSRLLAAGIEYNYPAAPERYRKIAETMGVRREDLMGEGARDALIARIDSLRRQAGLAKTEPMPLLSREDIEILAENSSADPLMATNPRPATKQDLEVIYERTIRPVRERTTA